MEGKNNSHTVVHDCTLQGGGDTYQQRPKVFTRVFYNSKIDKKDCEGLFARGNKQKVMNHLAMTKMDLGSGNQKHRGRVFKHSHTSKKVILSEVKRETQDQSTVKTKSADSDCKNVKVMEQTCNDRYNTPVVVQNGQGIINSVAPRASMSDDASFHTSDGGVINKGDNGLEALEKVKPQDNRVLPNDSTDCKLLFDINNTWDGDKFLNTVVPKHLDKYLNGKQQPNTKLFYEWRHQSAFDFGFVPLSDFIMPNNSEFDVSGLQCPFQMHEKIKASGSLNYLGCRIPLKSQLNISEWAEVLKGYWDTQLIELLTFGFPLDFNRSCPLQCEKKNHASAIEFPDDIRAYLEEEVKFGAIVGPFEREPIVNCHTSPFMTREKPNVKHRRVIIDLSWPKGTSVNAGVDKNSYLGTDFALTFPTIDHITSEIKKVGAGAHLYKIDISRAFRHIKVDPRDYDLLGLIWDDVTYVDTCVAFGTCHGTQIFQRVSDALRHVMRRRGFTVVNYVDDFVGIATPSVAQASYQFLTDLLSKLGLDISVKKLVPPSHRAICLGVEIDTHERTVSIPAEKLEHICELVQQWSTKKIYTKRQLQSLLGSLLYVHKCVRPARIFLNRMLDLLRQNYDSKNITITEEFKRDLRWFKIS